MKRLMALLPLLPSLAWAAEPVAQSAPVVANTVTGGMGGQIVQLLFGLLLVVGLIFVLAWVMRRVQRIGPNNSQVIELVSSRAIGPRDRLVLVQVGGEQVLLGITPGNITTLHVLKEPVQVPVREQTTPEFAQRLLELMGKDKGKK
ncbi:MULTISPECIES: flagellar biosynthetic protein FliO [Pseudomonas syringae group]|uniref:Flagellar protein n=2 Tax=Pseudomonas syringae group TaxID=136849 RepID=A0ABX6HFW0_9PSED|nr:flagellar biosynthetic protein FliO [Pseudomonas asturiensis]QHF04199.1 flagellar biosynthetic protein FliO [Pseudomonas asturiensis]